MRVADILCIFPLLVLSNLCVIPDCGVAFFVTE